MNVSPSKRSYCRSVPLVAIAVALAGSCAGSDQLPTHQIESVQHVTESVDSHILRMRESLVEDVGIDTVVRVDSLVSDQIESLFPYVKYRTYRDRTDALERSLEEGQELSDTERRAIMFDYLVQLALSSANRSRGGDIAENEGLLHDAFETAFAQCALDAGIYDSELLRHPSPEDVYYLYEGSYTDEEWQDDEGEVDLDDYLRRRADEHAQVAASLGLTSDELLDMRQECSRYAATLPTLAPSVREELMRQLRQHFLQAAYAHVAENPPDAICVEWPCE